MKTKISLLAASLLAAVPLQHASAQSFYGYGTSQTNAGASTILSNVAPLPPSGTNFLRVGTGGGIASITNTSFAPVGTNSQLRLIAPTSASVNKASVFNIGSPTTVFSLKQFVAFGNTNYTGTASSGIFNLFIGDGNTFANANAFSGAESFTGLRVGFGASGALAISNRVGANWVAITNTGLTQTNVFAIEIMGNNSAAATNYNYGGIERTLSANSLDLWVGGVLVGTNIGKALLANAANIDSFMWYAESSTANAAALFQDSVTYATSIATNSGRTFWTTNGAAALAGTWGTVGTTGATVGWGATATIAEGSPWVENNTAVFSANDTYTVTVTNTVNPANLEFLAGATTLSNGTVNLTFSNASILVTNGAAATISSVLGASNGFTKTGAGTLTLANSSNSFGPLAISAGGVVFSNSATITGLSGTGDLVLTNGTLTVSNSTASSFGGAISGSQGLTKLGSATLTLSGSSANTFAGTTTVSAGTLALAKSAGTAAVSGDVAVQTGATLLISANNQVADTSAVTLSGGTIKLDGGTTETFGNLTVSTASVLDFNNGTGFNLSFGTYSPTALLTINNFIGFSTLTFGSDLTSTINDPGLFAFSTGFSSAIWDSGTSTFTITAIPEPSTYAAAAGLLGLMLWPARRRILKDTQRIFGLRGSMRDRLARLRA